MMRQRGLGVLALAILALGMAGCFWQTSAGDDAPRSPRELTSYRWSIELRADSSLFDQSRAPEALRNAPFILLASVVGERVAPDRHRARVTVLPVAIEPRETVTIGQQRWHRIADGPWRSGGEAFPAARAYLGGSVDLNASAILEASDSPTVVQLRQAIASMPFREEQIQTGTARRYTLQPEQVQSILDDPAVNPFSVLRTLSAVRIDIWVDQAENVLVGVRVRGDTTTQVEAFQLDLRVTEIEPDGLTIEPPR